ncbi:phosphohistidine phosphatase SixA [Stygiolobus caldivivus]|nr:phosphohistidine phosphatase SixA [Stygiolobus caldivivus]
MLHLIIVRHGEAEPKVENIPDKDRKLIKKGLKQMRRVANFIDNMSYKIDKVFSSPYIRAYQSAEAVLEELDEDLKIETIRELEPDQDVSALVEKLKELNSAQTEMTIMLVGHEPHLSTFIKAITGGEVELKKGGVAVVEFDPTNAKGKLTILLTQKIMKRL